MTAEAPALPLPARTEFLTGEALLRGLRCAEARYPAGLRLGPHAHERPSVTLVAAGSVAERIGPGLRPAPCAPGAVVLRPAGAPHGNEVGPGGVTNVELELEPAFLGGHGLRLERPVVRSLAAAGLLARRLHRALHGRGQANALLVEGLALEALALVLPAEPSLPPAGWLERVHDRIRDEFRTAPGVAELAREAGVHPVYLARAFREQYGRSPAELARALRVEWAAEQLAAGDRPIAEIALAAGFYDQSHLTRALRAALGVPPAAYRRRARR